MKIRIIVITLAALSLTGCSASTADLSSEAAAECEKQVTPMFSDPDSVVWPDDSAVSARDGGYHVEAMVESDQGTTEVWCELTYESGIWFLGTWRVTAR